ncbi:hypothetical protein A2210_00220 [Candidatus Woesebacteria bacterium RIFOXYA1_FULL_40_18]|uniref:Uncharacterized protein n=2 Tax=Candidatus Woeseibacteriota TaxID=1752722 RepID=A0A1F8CKM0_9BACT|nr:MAG: hypothetical protein A2210_00220 [Candidatus Woesebacteria bacterium RIFOXYA1_FULL_40_18]OGM80776.1 MAG: hypothetical protein A2361_00990 [Candidatus Woesebacteria bacterium RIFOXYB1_FULL_40_26]
MKKILFSLLTIGVVAVVAVLGTKAYFSDQEQVLGNTISTGTITIDLTSESFTEQVSHFVIEDLKPSQNAYTNFTVVNTGTNPVNVWKKLEFGVCSSSRNPTQAGAFCDLENVTNYDLKVTLADCSFTQPGVNDWHHTIFKDGQNISMGTVYSTGQGVGGSVEKGVFLGMIPAGCSMDVTQSYHMPGTVRNEYQGATQTFDLTVYAEQLSGTVWFDNKDPNMPVADGYWTIADDIGGVLTYTVRDLKFHGSFTGKVTLPNTKYYLVAFNDPWSSADPKLAEGDSNNAGNLTFSFDVSVDTMTNQKLWLVPAADYSGGGVSGWPPTNFLFERGLMDYYESL